MLVATPTQWFAKLPKVDGQSAAVDENVDSADYGLTRASPQQ